MEQIDKSIFSIDENKIWIETQNNKLIFNKITTESEIHNIEYFKEILSQYNNIIINGKRYNLIIPEIYSFDQNIMKTEYFKGDNLETLLRISQSHNKAAIYLNNLLEFILDIQFRWNDFAPRNILINDKKICFVDFEKKSDDNSTIIFLRNHVYEEYSSFLLEHERLLSIDEITSASKEEVCRIINLNDIKIKRIKYIAKSLYNKEFISYQEYLNIIKYILIAEKPYYDNKQLIFPRLYLSTLLENKEKNDEAYINYAREIINRNKIYQKKQF